MKDSFPPSQSAPRIAHSFISEVPVLESDLELWRCFTRIVERISIDLPDGIGREGIDWEVVEGFQGVGYALTRPEERAELRWLAREEGILLDPVYTGKAWYALTQLVQQNDRRVGSRVLFWHTGGAFGLFGRGAEMLG